MKGMIKIFIEHFTQEAAEVAKWDEDKANEMTEWKPAYIRPEMIDAIASAKSDGKSVVYMRSGDSFVAQGTPKEVVEYIDAKVLNPY